METRRLESRGLSMKPNSVAVSIHWLLKFLAFAAFAGTIQAQKADGVYRPEIPRTWDDTAIADLEVRLADPVGSPKHVSADYYYKIPVRPIHKSYPIYAPGHEPPGYMDWLKQQEPEIVWDDKAHAPPLKTEADWIRAGQIVFDAPIGWDASEVSMM